MMPREPVMGLVLNPVLPQRWDRTFLRLSKTLIEEQNEVVWAPNKFVKLTIGRKPVTVREWLVEHREALLS